MKFAFYGRVSTEDQQDPTSSKQWQMARAGSILPADGAIVAEFFDIGQSRSLPWKRRPEALALLEALKNPGRDFGAIVIGEPARAFSGNQFGLTFPLLVHHNVELWVPEVGGKIDPGSDAHDLIMSLYGGMSKGERNRIKVRVKSSMAAQAQHEGRFLGGRPPYGYVLADAGAHPNPSKAAHGQRLRRLEIDPTAAPVVQRIFAEYIAGAGIGTIAERLNLDGIPSPSGHDPERNRHRASARGAWGKSAVRAILGNPKYTGRSVWNRQRRDEDLLDVEDVSAGYTSRMRWNDRSEWVWSSEETHEAIVSPETFAAASAQRSTGHDRWAVTKPRHRNTYSLSSLVHCGICGRRMSGAWNHGEAYYRCRFPSEYAGATGQHPSTVYLRESDITPALDAWLLGVFDPKNLDAAVAALSAAQSPDDGAIARAEAARRAVADCGTRLAKYRAALEAGADPAVVAGWIKEVEGDRLHAERELASTAGTAQPLTEAEIRALVTSQRKVLRDPRPGHPRAAGSHLRADDGPADHLHPDDASIEVEARPACTNGCVGGPDCAKPEWRIRPLDLRR
jgi:DNA invertase Pin-like site-specific DNA recombinase